MLRFADFEFDERAGELRRNGTATRLEPQPARVLALLVERAGDVVTRAELQQRVWSGDTFVDFDRGLNYCVAQIREALGDSASEPRFIETLPRRGYRFIASVHGSRDGLKTVPYATPAGDSSIAPATDVDAGGGGFQTVPPASPIPGIAPRKDISPLVAASAVAIVVALIAGASMLLMRRDAIKAK